MAMKTVKTTRKMWGRGESGKNQPLPVYVMVIHLRQLPITFCKNNLVIRNFILWLVYVDHMSCTFQ